LLRGKRRKETVCIAFTPEDPAAQDVQLRMNKGTRKNLRVRLGDVVTVTAIPELPNATQVKILPFADTIEGLTGDLTEIYIKPYF
jgi:transitional endoplasmic reticulum ATPase